MTLFLVIDSKFRTSPYFRCFNTFSPYFEKISISPYFFKFPSDFVEFTCFLHTLCVFRFPQFHHDALILCITQCTYWTPLNEWHNLLQKAKYTQFSLWGLLSAHSGYFYSTSSSPLLFRVAPDTARILWVKDLPKVPTWRLEQESNPWPFRQKASALPMRHTHLKTRLLGIWGLSPYPCFWPCF